MVVLPTLLEVVGGSDRQETSSNESNDDTLCCFDANSWIQESHLFDCSLIVDRNAATSMNGRCDGSALTRTEPTLQRQRSKNFKFLRGVNLQLLERPVGKNRLTTGELFRGIFGNLAPNVVRQHELKVRIFEKERLVADGEEVDQARGVSYDALAP